MQKFNWALVILFILGVEAQAKVQDNTQKGIHLDLGAVQTRLEKKWDAPTGYENLVSSLTGYVRLRGTVPLGKRIVWEPSLGTLLPWKSGVDGMTRKFTSHLDLTLSFSLLPWLRVRLGPGLKWLFSYGDGGEVVLNNGTSTSSFYTPGYASHSFVVTGQTGLSFILTSKISLNFELYGTGIFDHLRRSFDAAATLGWRL
ncbi:MAG: hypothetical protein ACKOA8_18000 [Deltaproteobacteria bacterium]